MPRYEENDDRIYSRRSREGRAGRWEPETHPRAAPSAFDYRDEYRNEQGRGSHARRGEIRPYEDYLGSGDGYARGPTFRPAPYARDEASLARRYEEDRAPGEGMMDLVRSFFGVGPKNYQRSDARIEEDVNEALYRDRELDASYIEVHVRNGVVTLQGSVGDRWSKWRAEDTLDDVRGVHDVQNLLSVDRGAGFRTDERQLARGAGMGGARLAEEGADGWGAQANLDTLAGRASPDAAAEATGTDALTGMPLTITTGGFNNSVVVPAPPSEEKKGRAV